LQNKGVETECVFPDDKTIRPCNGCFRFAEAACAFNDEVTENPFESAMD
jgi:multimeric flavodoxin WrbA